MHRQYCSRLVCCLSNIRTISDALHYRIVRGASKLLRIRSITVLPLCSWLKIKLQSWIQDVTRLTYESGEMESPLTFLNGSQELLT